MPGFPSRVGTSRSSCRRRVVPDKLRTKCDSDAPPGWTGRWRNTLLEFLAGRRRPDRVDRTSQARSSCPEPCVALSLGRRRRPVPPASSSPFGCRGVGVPGFELYRAPADVLEPSVPGQGISHAGLPLDQTWFKYPSTTPRAAETSWMVITTRVRQRP
jgi:hypothetical protein